MVVAAMQVAGQHIRSSLGFSILHKDASTCRPRELNQQPSYNNMLAQPLSHSQPVLQLAYREGICYSDITSFMEMFKITESMIATHWQKAKPCVVKS